MCLLCIEFQKNKMTLHEARNAFVEMRLGLSPQHVRAVEEMFRKAEEKEKAAQSEEEENP